MKPTSDNPDIKKPRGGTRTQQTRHNNNRTNEPQEKRSENNKAKQTEQKDGKRHETNPRQKQSPRAANNRRRKLREEGFRLFRFPKERTRTARGREGPEPAERPKESQKNPKSFRTVPLRVRRVVLSFPSRDLTSAPGLGWTPRWALWGALGRGVLEKARASGIQRSTAICARFAYEPRRTSLCSREFKFI